MMLCSPASVVLPSCQSVPPHLNHSSVSELCHQNFFSFNSQLLISCKSALLHHAIALCCLSKLKYFPITSSRKQKYISGLTLKKLQTFFAGHVFCFHLHLPSFNFSSCIPQHDIFLLSHLYDSFKRIHFVSFKRSAFIESLLTLKVLRCYDGETRDLLWSSFHMQRWSRICLKVPTPLFQKVFLDQWPTTLLLGRAYVKQNLRKQLLSLCALCTTSLLASLQASKQR